MRYRIAELVGGPLDGETKRIRPCRKLTWKDGEKRHVYRPSGQRGVWSYDMESSALETLAAAAATRRATEDAALDEGGSAA